MSGIADRVDWGLPIRGLQGISFSTSHVNTHSDHEEDERWKGREAQREAGAKKDHVMICSQVTQTVVVVEAPVISNLGGYSKVPTAIYTKATLRTDHKQISTNKIKIEQ